MKNVEKQQAEHRISTLSQLVNTYDHEYYVLSKPSVSDKEYDSLFQELTDLEEQFPELVKADSPSQRIGSDLSNDFPEREHSIPVLSLDKAYSIDEIAAWVHRCRKSIQDLKSMETREFRVLLEVKLDGSSLVLYYKKGILQQAVTRGNGAIGNDITNNVKTIRSVPLRLTQELDAIVRGEVFLPISEFKKIQQEQNSDYANPRNFASGSLRRIYSSQVAQIPLCFNAYDLFADGYGSSQSENVKALEKLGFLTSEHSAIIDIQLDNALVHTEFLTEIEKHIHSMQEIRRNLDYEIDGLVLKIDSISLHNLLGFTGHHPRWAIAYKFESPQGRTMVEKIDVQIGRSGRITPVARVSPVYVGGTTIRNITLHNEDYVHQLGLAPGDTVAVSRRGDVIPAIENVIEKGESNLWHMPPNCPSCFSELEKNGAHHFCLNFDCPSRTLGRLSFFTDRNQMDIENLGSETLTQLLAVGIINDIPDIFCLDYTKIAELPGFANKKIELIRNGVESARKRSYRRVLVSLGLADLGPKMAELLEDNGYKSIDSLFELVDAGEESKLLEIKGVGEKTVQSIANQLREPNFRKMIEELKSQGLNFYVEEQISEQYPQIFAGQSWCVTGSFENFKPRSIAIDAIKKRGGLHITDVSSKTSHLLCGSSAGSKLRKAQNLGVKIVSEDEFLELIS